MNQNKKFNKKSKKIQQKNELDLDSQGFDDLRSTLMTHISNIN